MGKLPKFIDREYAVSKAMTTADNELTFTPKTESRIKHIIANYVGNLPATGKKEVVDLIVGGTYSNERITVTPPEIPINVALQVSNLVIDESSADHYYYIDVTYEFKLKPFTIELSGAPISGDRLNFNLFDSFNQLKTAATTASGTSTATTMATDILAVINGFSSSNHVPVGYSSGNGEINAFIQNDYHTVTSASYSHQTQAELSVDWIYIPYSQLFDNAVNTSGKIDVPEQQLATQTKRFRVLKKLNGEPITNWDELKSTFQERYGVGKPHAKAITPVIAATVKPVFQYASSGSGVLSEVLATFELATDSANAGNQNLLDSTKLFLPKDKDGNYYIAVNPGNRVIIKRRNHASGTPDGDDALVTNSIVNVGLTIAEYDK